MTEKKTPENVKIAERNASSAFMKFRSHGRSTEEVSRANLKKHLDERLQFLHQRAMVIEKKLDDIDRGRFYRACIFGSARLREENPTYHMVFELARLLAREGIDVLTGGGPGLMEAGNRGAEVGQEEAGTNSLSFGLPIALEFEPDPNYHLDVRRHHYRFSYRLDDFMRLSNIVICTPGGIGTLLELFFSWQLVQVHHIERRPIILLDKKFWSGLLEWMHAEPHFRGLISDKDFNFVHTADTPEEAMKIVMEDYEEFKKHKVEE